MPVTIPYGVVWIIMRIKRFYRGIKQKMELIMELCQDKKEKIIQYIMIASYFTAEPDAAKDFMRRVEEWEKEEEQREQEHFEELRKYVNSLSKAELQDKLYDALVKLEDRRNNYW